tara:strand:- start:472 stop:816 length:345 start_codon:yes stop_codon:yes gene_type:complete
MWNPSGRTTSIAETNNNPDEIEVSRCRLSLDRATAALAPPRDNPSDIVNITADKTIKDIPKPIFHPAPLAKKPHMLAKLIEQTIKLSISIVSKNHNTRFTSCFDSSTKTNFKIA